jgi:hypothetical protein
VNWQAAKDWISKAYINTLAKAIVKKRLGNHSNWRLQRSNAFVAFEVCVGTILAFAIALALVWLVTHSIISPPSLFFSGDV